MRGEEMHFEENVELSIAWRLSVTMCDNVENVNFAEKVQKMQELQRKCEKFVFN